MSIAVHDFGDHDESRAQDSILDVGQLDATAIENDGGEDGDGVDEDDDDESDDGDQFNDVDIEVEDAEKYRTSTAFKHWLVVLVAVATRNLAALSREATVKSVRRYMRRKYPNDKILFSNVKKVKTALDACVRKGTLIDDYKTLDDEDQTEIVVYHPNPLDRVDYKTHPIECRSTQDHSQLYYIFPNMTEAIQALDLDELGIIGTLRGIRASTMNYFFTWYDGPPNYPTSGFLPLDEVKVSLREDDR
jgi:hypothetical protein